MQQQDKESTNKGDGEMFSNIGFPGLILILVAVLILFGPKNCRKSERPQGNVKRIQKSTKELTDDAFQEKEKKEKCNEFSS